MSPSDFACHLPVSRDLVVGRQSPPSAIVIESSRLFPCSPVCLQIHFRQSSDASWPASARQSILPPTSIEYCKILLLLLLLSIYYRFSSHSVSGRRATEPPCCLSPSRNALAVSKRQLPRFNLFLQFCTVLLCNRPSKQSSKLSHILYPLSRSLLEFACKNGLSSC